MNAALLARTLTLQVTNVNKACGMGNHEGSAADAVDVWICRRAELPKNDSESLAREA